MQFLGDNTRFGTEPVELNGERLVAPLVDDDEQFPFGVQGLLPVETSRKKKGGVKVVYAFRFEQGEPPADDELAQELTDACGFANILLKEASEFCGHEFGAFEALWLGVTEKGYSFTRVEEAPRNADGSPCVTPVHLRLETSGKANEPNSLSAVIEYDTYGYAANVLITELGEDGCTRRVTASYDPRCGQVIVTKVVESRPNETEPFELYRRFRDSRYEQR